jgi:hypothetical protein
MITGESLHYHRRAAAGLLERCAADRSHSATPLPSSIQNSEPWHINLGPSCHHRWAACPSYLILPRLLCLLSMLDLLWWGHARTRERRHCRRWPYLGRRREGVEPSDMCSRITLSSPPAHSSGSGIGMVSISKIISNIDYDATELHVTVPRKSRHAYYD